MMNLTKNRFKIQIQSRFTSDPALFNIFIENQIAFFRLTLKKTEIKLMIALNYDINLPVSYLYTKRFAKIVQYKMPEVLFVDFISCHWIQVL